MQGHFWSFREFFQAFMTSIAVFGNNDIKDFWWPLWLGSILAAAMAATAATATAAATTVAAATAMDAATVKFSAPAIAATFV